MSLIKQLWLIIALVLLLAFGGSLAIGIATTRDHVEQELRIKNIDNANALALSMSQLDKDPVAMELLLAAQFDTGHYRRIALRGPEGERLLEREADPRLEGVPGWFVALIDLSAPSGRAVVQDGWRQYGTLTLQSQHSYAYLSLWQGAQRLALWFGIAALFSGGLAWWAVRSIRLPLQRVVTQANDIGQQRFTTSREPRIRELRDVTSAMNRLSSSVKGMLQQESQTLERLRVKLQEDALTGIANRQHFLNRLDAALDADSPVGHGSLVLVRVANLDRLNLARGHQATNRLLIELAQRLARLGEAFDAAEIGRLNGSDFALLLPGHDDLDTLAATLRTELQPLTAGADDEAAPLGLPMAILSYAVEEPRSDLLGRLDGALAKAEIAGDRGTVTTDRGDRKPLYPSLEEWRTAIDEAMRQGIRLARHPVRDKAGGALHLESPSRLQLAGEWRSAAVFMPWVSRLAYNVDFDLRVVETALHEIIAEGTPLAVNLSPQAVQDSRFITAIKELLRRHPEAAAKLWLELPEPVAVHYLEELRGLCHELRAFGCAIGIKHVGREFARIADLQDIGLTHLKFDASLTRHIDANPQQQNILRGMVMLSHSIGILAIAEGVNNASEHDTLLDIGMDAVTGPGVH